MVSNLFRHFESWRCVVAAMRTFLFVTGLKTTTLDAEMFSAMQGQARTFRKPASILPPVAEIAKHSPSRTRAAPHQEHSCPGASFLPLFQLSKPKKQ